MSTVTIRASEWRKRREERKKQLIELYKTSPELDVTGAVATAINGEIVEKNILVEPLETLEPKNLKKISQKIASSSQLPILEDDKKSPTIDDIVPDPAIFIPEITSFKLERQSIDFKGGDRKRIITHIPPALKQSAGLKGPVVPKKIEIAFSKTVDEVLTNPMEVRKTLVPKGDWFRKPKIMLIVDVVGWAWWLKSQYLIKYLSDEYDFNVVSVVDGRSTNIQVDHHDFFFTFGYAFIDILKQVPIERRISGVTAHKDEKMMKNMIIPSLKKAKWIHANSILLKQEMEEKWGFKGVFYVPNGVDEQLFREIEPIPEKRSNLIVGHVGKLCHSNSKGQLSIIEPACKKAGVEYRPHYNRYQNRVEHKDMVHFYQNVDLFICASKTDGTPNGALEAAACNRPVVSCPIGNMPEFIKQGWNGYLVDRNVDSFAKKLGELKEQRELVIKMGKNARKTVETEWTWRYQSERYRNMLRRICNSVGLNKRIK